MIGVVTMSTSILGFVLMIVGLARGSEVLFGWGLAAALIGGIAEIIRARRAASANRIKPCQRLDPTRYYERDF